MTAWKMNIKTLVMKPKGPKQNLKLKVMTINPATTSFPFSLAELYQTEVWLWKLCVPNLLNTEERDTISYMWKTLEGHVPDFSIRENFNTPTVDIITFHIQHLQNHEWKYTIVLVWDLEILTCSTVLLKRSET